MSPLRDLRVLCGESGPQFSLAAGDRAAQAYVARAAAALGGRYPEVDFAAARVTYLDAGIMNYVYRVEAPGGTFFLKQALPQVKRAGRLGPDLAGVSPARIRVEERALHLLRELLPREQRDSVPAVAWYDADSNILWTEDAAPGAPSLQQRLQAGECDAGFARRLGRLLGTVHAVSRGSTPLWSSEAEDRGNWERFLRMRTTGVLVRAGLPAAAEALARDLQARGRQAEQRMVSHLDAAPKNVLVRADGSPVLLDFELGAAVSDPAYDPGFLAGHFLLTGANDPGTAAGAVAAAAEVARGYREAAAVDPRWEERFARYAGLAMLYRLYGSSPAPYLAPERYEAVRAAGLRVLLGGSVSGFGETRG